ncbi:MAG: STAS/SEC14 domain-containing protein [Candidatus Eisenbacteria sp.]|nr:STAS/SEC14 domain-containing protein [Candidatus Eisenbacteria bacterium]
MPCDLSVDAAGRLILVHLSGAVTDRDIVAALEEILNIRGEQQIDRILCDQRAMESAPDTLGVLDAARTFSLGPFRGMRLAILRAAMPEGPHFFETACRNRMADVRVFDDEEEAREWLGP